MQKFQVTWELHNKHLFEDLVFSEPLLQSSLPALVSQIRYSVFTCMCPAGVTACSRPWGAAGAHLNATAGAVLARTLPGLGENTVWVESSKPKE